MELTGKQKLLIGGNEWYVLKLIGDKYFLLAESPLFKGYYSLKPCDYADSKLANFINNKFLPELEYRGLDIKKISNVSILTAGQYKLYVKDKLPMCSAPYLLQTVHPSYENYIIAVDIDGELYPSKVTDLCGVRPCMFIEKTYADELAESSDMPYTIETVYDFLNRQEFVAPTVEVVQNTPPVNAVSETSTDKSEKDAVAEFDKASDDSDVVAEDVREGTVAALPEEDVGVAKTSEGKDIPVSTYGERKAAHVFDEEYKDFAVLYDGTEKELNEIVSAYGLVIQAFAENTKGYREPVSKESIIRNVNEARNRWRWAEKK